MGIKYDKKLEQKIANKVKNYNDKVKLINAKYGKKLLSRETIASVKREHMTRRELERKLKSLDRLRSNTRVIENKAGVALTKYEWDELKRGLAYAKSARTKRLKHTGERPENQVSYGLKTNRYEQVKESRKALDRYDLDYVDEAKLERLRTAIRSEEKRSLYTKNFYDEFFNRMIETQDYADVDPILINDLKNKLQDLDPNAFLDMYNNTPELKTIFESIETKGFRRQMTGYRGNKSQLAVDDDHFNGMLNQLQQKLPSYIEKYG